MGGAVGARLDALAQVLGLVIDKGLVNLAREAVGHGGTVGCSSRGTGDAVGSGVRLAGNRGLRREVGRRGRVADAEDGRLPAFALGSQLGVLGGLVRDTTGQLDLGEDRVTVGQDGLDLGVALDSSLGLLGLGLGAGADRVDVAGEDAGGVLRFLAGSLLSTLSLGVNVMGESIAVDEGLADLALNHLLKGGANDTVQHRLEGVEEELMAGLLELDVHALDVHGHLVKLDEMLLITLLGGGGSNLEAEALASKNNVHDTSVSDRREALLLLDVVADVTQISLDTAHGDHDLVVALVGDLLPAPAEVVVATKLHHVGQEVVALNNEVLDDDVYHGVGHLNSGNRDVADVLEDARNDDVTQILEQVLLENDLAISITAKILEQLLD